MRLMGRIRRGRPPEKGFGIKQLMFAMPPGELASMKCEQMEAHFGVSKSYCARLRNETQKERVLLELKSADYRARNSVSITKPNERLI